MDSVVLTTVLDGMQIQHSQKTQAESLTVTAVL